MTLGFERTINAVNFSTDYQSTSLQTEAVSLQYATSANLVTGELEDEDATEDFVQIRSPQHLNNFDVPPICFEDVDPQWTLKL